MGAVVDRETPKKAPVQQAVVGRRAQRAQRGPIREMVWTLD
ncbi:hypothetical protein I545_4710 [Mycobacterium kansasii 662]|uniref:Uncharacterized protein n=2 Tax=Mycobacterium kansasii TaxID=1768 RepID=A0A1V3WWD1_MYCKA|nr:hypothetical protein I547_2561 [Mycobacterium kansasii 824]EUA13433.1 hypothetical protein I545_4710 [Mycobacterium kansasii 662]KEP44791.1 hypothetical protein MKSMC1_00320 [Mycobacterium kansasii]OOK71240.1 hypothetical protein BZL29_5654 [Mycobacterium kansasii]